MHLILQDPDSGLSSNGQDIPPITKRPKMLSGVRQPKKLVCENRHPLYPGNCNMPYSSHNPRSSIVICR